MRGQNTHRVAEKQTLTLFLCGDVMTGRGIDQILPHAGDATLHEPYVKNAGDYVTLAERHNGNIPKPVQPAYIWGDALPVFEDIAPDVRIGNLETAITASDVHWPGKGIHYRMSPGNLGCLQASQLDCFTLANNHVLDWGYAGLRETLALLEQSRLHSAGAGLNTDAASAPARISVATDCDVLIFSFADTSSGVPRAWGAGRQRAGVNLLPDLSTESARHVAGQMLAVRRAGDIVVASIHWGGNWGYDIPDAQRGFAHCLIDHGAADIVHGHSSHHPKAVEIYRNKAVVYGCGDFITDYEGIGGHGEYRPWLSLMYFVTLNRRSGEVAALHIVPLRVYRMQLVHASSEDCCWLLDKLNTEGKIFSTRFTLVDNRLALAEPAVA